MITAFGPLNLSATHRTEDDTIGALESIKRPRHGSLTARTVTMPFFSAAEADRMVTLRAIHLLGVHIGSNHVSITVSLRTESHERIAFEDTLVFEML